MRNIIDIHSIKDDFILKDKSLVNHAICVHLLLRMKIFISLIVCGVACLQKKEKSDLCDIIISTAQLTMNGKRQCINEMMMKS